jgi:hypothetical protein
VKLVAANVCDASYNFPRGAELGKMWDNTYREACETLVYGQRTGRIVRWDRLPTVIAKLLSEYRVYMCRRPNLRKRVIIN